MPHTTCSTMLNTIPRDKIGIITIIMLKGSFQNLKLLQVESVFGNYTCFNKRALKPVGKKVNSPFLLVLHII